MNKFVAFFPGQGSQQVGMAKDLVSQFRVAQEVFEEASDAISVNLRKLCFEGPESDLTLTENTQPCLLTASIAAFRVATTELGARPSAVAGHSLGEYSALVAAESLPLATAVRWVRERGRAMQAAVPAGQGTMAAILGMEDAVVGKLCAAATSQAKTRRAQGEYSDVTVEAIVEPANFNAPGQIVIAGSTDAVGEAIALIKGGGDFAGAKAIPLSVSAPFHCRLMRKARDRMGELFAQSSAAEKPRSPFCPYVPNRTGRLTQEAGLVFELLVEQVDHPVLWSQSVTGLLDAGFGHAVEFGPGAVLAGLAKRIAKQAGKPCHTAGMSDSATLKALETFLKENP
ncbi:MAG: ACP S-malonyltransferase [Oligoflexia bacterium]|nr:ACP S-malonyltransferase [Oligoflexia bacterium]